MRLTRRDGIATLAVAAVAALYWAYRSGTDLSLLSGPRALSIAVFVLGVTACAIGGNTIGPGQDKQPRWAQIYGIHGALAFVLMVLVLITGSSTLLAVLVGLVLLLWLLTTVRHAVVTPTPASRKAMAART
jgi:hypothetical protein